MDGLLTTELLISAYSIGIFPMAESRDGEIGWFRPETRAIFDIYATRPSRSTRMLFRKNIYSYAIDNNFRKVIEYCADREDTWINSEIIKSYTELQSKGFAHSVEVYRGDRLTGGLYGVCIGGAFFGESMFNTESNTAKLAFAVLLEILKKNNYLLLDSQFLNPFTAELGAIEISEIRYLQILQRALNKKCSFVMPENLQI